MDKWPHQVTADTTAEIAVYVRCPVWQSVRLSMKGMPTTRKLITLDAYRDRVIAKNSGRLSREHEVQINNYLKALKRGGQLNDHLEVVR